MKTYSPKPTDISRSWFVVDAAEAPLGRLSTHIATLLTGKQKPMYAHHIDCGDYVIVINAEKAVVTGTKETDKTYYSYSGFPGGLTERSLREQRERFPERVIEHAVRGMLPVDKLRDARLKRLKIYSGPEHGHTAQQPKPYSVKKDTK